jgi:hypothetical protein
MTFDEYRLVLGNHGYSIKYASDCHVITVFDKDHNQVIKFDSMGNEESIPNYYFMESMPLNKLTFLLNSTIKFLSTPYEKRKLEPIYQLVWDVNSYGQWVLGYDHDLWEIGKADALEDQGYQVNFTNDELDNLTCNNPDLASRLEALKRRVNYK